MNELSSILWVTFIGYLVAISSGGALPDIGRHQQVGTVLSALVEAEPSPAASTQELFVASGVDHVTVAETSGIVHVQQSLD